MNCRVRFEKQAAREAYRAAERAVTSLLPDTLMKERAESLVCLDLDDTLKVTLDVEKAAKQVGMRDHVRGVSEILSDFFVKSDDGYRNGRADREIAAYKAKAERARGANASRWKAQKSDAVLKSDAKSDTKSDAVRIPTNNQEPVKNYARRAGRVHRSQSRAAWFRVGCGWMPGWLISMLREFFVLTNRANEPCDEEVHTNHYLHRIGTPMAPPATSRESDAVSSTTPSAGSPSTTACYAAGSMRSNVEATAGEQVLNEC